MGPRLKIVAVVLNWRRASDTIECVRSINETSPHTQVVVVDNASNDGSVERLKAAGIEPIVNPVNAGYSGGNNDGMSAALAQGADAVLVLNNDLIVRPGCIQALDAALQERPDAGIVAPLGLLKNDPNVVDFWRAKIDIPNLAVNAIGRDEPKQDWTEPEQTDYATGSAMLIRSSVLNRIGFFDDRFFLVWEDVDFSLRAIKAHFKVFAVPAAEVLHERSVSFGGEGAPLYQYFYVRNSFLIAAKHNRPWLRSRARALLYRRYRGWVEQSEGANKRAIALGLQHGVKNRFGPPPAELFAATDS